MEEAWALSAAMTGDGVEAMRRCENAIDAARLTANGHVTAAALIAHAWVHLHLAGDIDDALRSAEKSVRLARGSDSAVAAGTAAALNVLAAARAGHDTAELDALIEGAGGWEMPLVPMGARPGFLEAIAETQLSIGNLERAEELTFQAERLAAGLRLKVPTALSRRARARMLLAGGHAAGAVGQALESAASADAAGAKIEAARSRALAGRALAAAGERNDAIELLGRAERELDRCGAVGHRNEGVESRPPYARLRLHTPSEPPFNARSSPQRDAP
jgi:tetratricopeptide (TPR) repeat protein